jgi:nucleoside-diphosphate-sugar epimerase
MKTLIIGGTGNIAKGIIKCLKSRNSEIFVFHRGKTKLSDEEIKSIKGNIDDEASVNAAIKSEKFDVVIDLIGTTTKHATALANACAKHVKQVIYSSSVATYGNEFLGRSILPTDTQKPISEFAKNKFESEKILFEHTFEKKFDLTIMRLSNIYGYDRVMPCNISLHTVAWDRILNNLPVLCTADGLSITNITHIDDIGRGFAFACLNQSCFQKAYHLVLDKCLTWQQYYQRIGESLEKEISIIYAPKTAVLYRGEGKYNASLGSISGFHQFYDSVATYRDIPEFQQTLKLTEGAKQVIINAHLKGRLPKWDSDLIYNQIIEDYARKT